MPRTNHPINLKFEPVRKGDPKTMTELSDEAGIYILGAMHPVNKDVFCPLYVGKKQNSLRKNIIRHYEGSTPQGRRGFFNGNTLFDVNSDFNYVYEDIRTLYRPLPSMQNLNRKILSLQQAYCRESTLLWFNNSNFYNMWFNTPNLYQSLKSKVNDESPHDMFSPSGHWALMQQKAGHNAPLLEKIKAMEQRFCKAWDLLKKNFAFTYASIDAAEIHLAYPLGGITLGAEEGRTTEELQRRCIFTHNRANTNTNFDPPIITVDFTKLNLYNCKLQPMIKTRQYRDSENPLKK